MDRLQYLLFSMELQYNSMFSEHQYVASSYEET